MGEQQIHDGGAAFPCEGGDMSQLIADPGMSLRDYFAAKVMEPLLESTDDEAYDKIGESVVNAQIAQQAYALADAMLAQRAKADPQDLSPAEES